MASKGKIRSKKHKTNKIMIDDDESDVFEYYDKHTGGTLCDKILLNNKLRFAIVMFFFAIVLPLLVLYLVSSRGNNTDDMSDVWGTCSIKDEYRVPCLIGRSVNQQYCGSIGCCWNQTNEECYHSLPSKYQYLINSTDNSNLSLVLQPQTRVTPFRTDMVAFLKCVIEPISDTHLRIRFENENNGEPTYNSSIDLQDTLFNVTVSSNPKERFFVEILRRLLPGDTRNASMLLSTARGPLMASRNFWELTLQLPKGGVTYGLGRLRLKTKVENPKVLHSNANNTGSHPILISIDSEGETSGIYIRNGGPMEVLFFHESNFLVLRSLSNEGFDINLFAGPTPKEVLSQLTGLLGRPMMPPYWALGLHVCRDTEGEMENVTAIMDDFEKFVAEAEKMGLPYDSHCLHERLLHDLTYDISNEEDLVKITAGLDQLHNNSRQFLLSLPPHVAEGNSTACTTALEEGILVRESIGDAAAYIGDYEQVPVVYPDWSHPGSESWMADRVAGITARLEHSVDGLVLQDNWPANNSTYHSNDGLEYLPERVQGSLSNGTIWWQAVHNEDVFHNVLHNTYSLLHTERAFNALQSASSVLLSASSHPGGGQYSGSHQQSSSKVPAKWASLKEMLSSALGLGLSGIPLASGGSACGSMSDFNSTDPDHEALCLKWYLLSVTLPLFRVSSIAPYRDPTTFSSGFMRKAIVNAVKFRYALLPYYYTLFSEAHETGTPVARPMFFEFPQDNVTSHMDEQFMLGAALMVAPVLQPRALSVQVYLPKVPNEKIRWYHFIGGYPINNGTGGHLLTVSTLETEILMLIRSGHIVPIQNVSVTATSSRLSPHHLVVGLDCSVEPCSARGQLYLDSADQASNSVITFTANSMSLTVSNLNSTRSYLCNDQNSTHISTLIDAISVYGISDEEDFRMSVNTRSVTEGVLMSYFKKDLVLRISNLPINWCTFEDDDLVISWI